jgi:hypothetical protein
MEYLNWQKVVLFYFIFAVKRTYFVDCLSSDMQGRAALEEHFRNSRFACDNDEYLPLCFSPPRNGTTPSPPTVAAGHSVGCAVGSSSSHEDQGSGWMTRDGDVRERAGDENTKRVSSNGINHNHEQEMDQAGVHGRVLGGNRTNGPQHHR